MPCEVCQQKSEEIRDILHPFGLTYVEPIGGVRILAETLMSQRAALDDFRRWLAAEMERANGLGAITDEPIITCLTVARGRIEALANRDTISRQLLESCRSFLTHLEGMTAYQAQQDSNRLLGLLHAQADGKLAAAIQAVCAHVTGGQESSALGMHHDIRVLEEIVNGQKR